MDMNYTGLTYTIWNLPPGEGGDGDFLSVATKPVAGWSPQHAFL